MRQPIFWKGEIYRLLMRATSQVQSKEVLKPDQAATPKQKGCIRTSAWISMIKVSNHLVNAKCVFAHHVQRHYFLKSISLC